MDFKLKKVDLNGNGKNRLAKWQSKAQDLWTHFSKTQFYAWGERFLSTFSFVEKIVLGGLVLTVVISGSMFLRNGGGHFTFFENRSGGVYVEGLAGQPNLINPLYDYRNDIDRDLAQIVYLGLTKVNANREVVPALATHWDTNDNGKSYTFYLRKNLSWPDGEKFTADDVLFTLGLIFNPDYNGLLTNDWNGVSYEKIDDFTIRFNLSNVSAGFLANTTLGILPKHIWGAVGGTELTKTSLNLQPMGMGPFTFEKAATHGNGELSSITLVRNEYYYDRKANLNRVLFRFYANEGDLLSAYQRGEISGVGNVTVEALEELIKNTGSKVYSYLLPQYKAIFLNQLGSNQNFPDKSVRQALYAAVPRQKIIDDVLAGAAQITETPIVEGLWGHLPSLKKVDYNLENAKKILDDANWKDADGDGYREKDNIRLAFYLTYNGDSVRDYKIFELVKENWEALGAQVLADPLSGNELQAKIKARGYDALIFGQSLGADSDPYAYWHSSQIHDPGLTLAVFFSKDVDNLIEAARLTTSLQRRIELYHSFQQVIAKEVPAVFLYQPKYIYLVNSKVRNVLENISLSDPSDRFMGIESWYVGN